MTDRPAGGMRGVSAGGAGLAAELDRLRTQAGLSFRDLSKLTGHPVSTLHNALRGRVFPRLDTVLAIVRACGRDERPWRDRWAALARAGGGQGAAGPESAVPHELPRAPRAFVGRRDELARLAAMAGGDSNGAGIVAVYGMPGVGKTAFAVQAAHQLSSGYPDGQLFVDLRGHRAGAAPMSAAEALPALLRSLGFAAHCIPAAVDAQIRLYRTVVNQRRILIVLDDALDAEQVRALVPGGAGCMVIVTSRHRLDGMVALDGAHAFPLNVLTTDESREMLSSLIGEQGATAYGELAVLCGHLPLALRVVAANVNIHPHISPLELVTELAGNRINGLRMPADRQVAVRAAFTSSYHKLTPVSARLLRRLGTVACGQFTLGSAMALLGSGGSETQQALDELEASCLIEQQAARRYGMHDLIRHYAADRAQEEEDTTALAGSFGRLMDWYRRRADAASRRLLPEMLRLPGDEPSGNNPFEDKPGALAWLDAEIGNLVAVMGHAATVGGPAAWRLADSLRGYFILRFRLTEWISIAESGLRVAQRHEDLLGQGAMRHSLGMAQSRHGDNQAAERHLAEALTLYRAAGWAEGTCAILICLGGSYFHEGRLDDASAALEEALAIASLRDLPALEAAALGDLGEVYRDRGLLYRAREHQTRTAACCHALGMERGHAIALLCLGLVCIDLGEPAHAQGHFTEALGRCLALGSRDGEAYAELGLALAALETGAFAHARHQAGTSAVSEPGTKEFARAHDQASHALALAGAISENTLVVEARMARAEALGRLHQLDEAVAEAGYASELAATCGYQRGIPRTLIVLANIERAIGRPGEARTHCQRALELSKRHGYEIATGRALTLLAALDHDDGRAEAGLSHAGQALAIHRRTGHRQGEAESLMLMSRLSEAMGQRDSARRHLREGQRILAGYPV
jgi:tetratricopeptide (TPR) repeat protein/transcriptional regulator with XRE-family HTH domain